MKDRIRLGNRKDKLIKPIIEGDSFEAWKAAVATGGFYADIDNNNTTGDDAGVSEAGTPLNKANTLPDTLKMKLGLTGDPTIADAINKTALRKTYTAAISATWTGDTAPYTQEVTVTGILSSDSPHVTPVYDDDNATAITQKEAWDAVSKGVAGANTITFTCFEDKPTVAIPIQVEVLR